MATAKQIRNRGRFSLLLGALVATVLFAAVAYADNDPAPACAQTGTETVATDKQDYAPGEVVHMTGGGYAASCAVVVKVTRPDGSVVTGDGSSTPGSDAVTTSAGGSLAYDYQLNALKGEFLVEVLGAGDVVLATTTFTDETLKFVTPTAANSSLQYKRGDTATVETVAQQASRWYLFYVRESNSGIGSPATLPPPNIAPGSAVSACVQGNVARQYSFTPTNANRLSTDGTSGLYQFRLYAFSDNACTTRVTAGDTSINFAVGQAYAFKTLAARDACTAEPTVGTPCAGAATVFLPGETAFMRVLGFGPSINNIPSTFTKPNTTTCAATAASDPTGAGRPESGTTGLVPRRTTLTSDFLEYPPTTVGWTGSCGAITAADGGQWTLTLNQSGFFNTFNAFTVASGATVSTTIHNAGHTAVTAVEVGSTVHDSVSVTGPSGGPTPTGSVTIDWFLNGTCAGSPQANSGPIALSGGQVDATSFSFMVNSAGQRAFLAHYLGDGTYTPSNGPCEPLSVVDANIQITGDGVNRVGQTHTFTGHVNVNDGTGFTNAPAGTTINFSFNGNPPSQSCSTVAATGSCTVSYSSAITGVDTVTASTTVTVSGVSLTRTTNGSGGNSGPATKRWVNARISIAPNATNEVGQPHTFTVTLQQDTGDGNGFVAAPGQHVDFTLTNANGASAALNAGTSTCDDAGPNTGASGQCTIVFTSASPGQVTGNATSTLSVAGSAPFTVSTNGVSPNSGAAVKTFVDANIQITPQTATNPVGTNHTFIGHVNINDGSGAGYVNAPAGTVITFAIDLGPGSFVGPNSCATIGATGSCPVVLTSATTGTTTVSAHTTVSVGGVALTRHTDGTGANSDPATKLWADDTVTTEVHDSAHNDITNTTVAGGVAVHDEATVQKAAGTPAEVPNPTGSVTFTLYDNGTCNGNVVATDPNKPLNASGTAESATFTTPAVIATYSYLAHYNGDANYPAHDGPCEPFSVEGVPPVTTITLDPANPDVCCWYTFAVRVSVSATDVGSGVAETRCVLDPATPPATFGDLPATPPCPYLMGAWVVTEGIHTICAASRDNIGNEETPVCRTFKIDKTAPTSQVDPLPQFQPNPGPFTVSWSGMDNLSGIKDFDVRYRTAPAGGSFGPYTQWFTDTPLTSASFTPTPGSTVCFSVRARDRACWQQFTYSPEVCTTAPYDDPSLTRTGYWSTVSGSGYFGPGVSRSTSPGNKLTLTGLRGSVIGVLVTKQPGGGTIELRWNGSTKLSTSLSAGSVLKKQLLTFNLGSVQTGTLDIVQTGYGTVEIDAAGAYKAS